MKIIPTLLFLLVQLSVFAQKDTVEDDNRPFEKVINDPFYRGGDSAWNRYISENLRYPAEAKAQFSAGTEHVIKARFIIETNGTASGIVLPVDPGYGFREEITRLLSSGDKWIPAKQGGRAVKAFVTRTFTFVRPE